MMYGPQDGPLFWVWSFEFGVRLIEILAKNKGLEIDEQDIKRLFKEVVEGKVDLGNLNEYVPDKELARMTKLAYKQLREENRARLSRRSEVNDE